MRTGIISQDFVLGKSAAVLTLNAGAIFEGPGLRGISHLVEHVACEAYTHMETRLSRLAIDDNAYTGTDEVRFYIRGLTKNVDQVVEEWMNSLLTYIPTEAVFNQELAVVKQEYDDSLGSNPGASYVNAVRQHFGCNTAYGVRQDLENIDFDTFSRFYGQLLGDLRSAFFVLGSGSSGIPWSLHENLKARSYRHAIPTVDPGVRGLDLEYKSSSTNATILDLIPCPASVRLWELDFVGALLAEGPGSPLLKRLRVDLGYVYSVGLNCLSHVGGTGVLAFETSTSPRNVNSLRSEFKSLLAPAAVTEARFAEIVEKTGYDLEERNMFRTGTDYINSVTFDPDFTIDLEKLAGLTYARVQEILIALSAADVRKTDFAKKLRIHPVGT